MERTPSEVARELAALQRRERKACAHCGREFEGVLRARYCSRACATDAYWDAHREELNRKRREKYRRQKARQEPPAATTETA